MQAARRDRGIYEVLIDDKDYFKIIADTRLKLGEDTALALSWIEKNDIRGEPQTGTTSIDASEEQSDAQNTGACGK